MRKNFEDNRKMCAIFSLGQESTHGFAIMKKTKSIGHPFGKAFEAIKLMQTKCQPSDTTAEIELEAELM